MEPGAVADTEPDIRRDRLDPTAEATPGTGLSASAPRRACRVAALDGAAAWFRDEVVTEYPLTILVNGREMATIACTPTHLEDLVLGFLAAEGVLRPGEEPADLYVIPEEGIAVAEVAGREIPEAELFGKRYVGSCCGKSRTGFYFANDARTARPVEGTLALRPADCFRLMEDLQAASPLFSRTGGAHNAGLATPGRLEVVRTDIGRHNTLDKLYGHALRAGVTLGDRLVTFSGRVSSEVLLKVAKMGCPAIVSKSAATDLALDMAEDLGVTVVGFLRGGRLNAYTHPERITGLPRG